MLCTPESSDNQQLTKHNNNVKLLGEIIPGPRGYRVLSKNTGTLWKQWLLISSLLFMVASSGLKSMYHFSKVQSAQTPVMGENGCALSSIFQLIL